MGEKGQMEHSYSCEKFTPSVFSFSSQGEWAGVLARLDSCCVLVTLEGSSGV